MTATTIRILHSTPPALAPVVSPALVPVLLGPGVTVEAVEERHTCKNNSVLGQLQ